MRLRLRQRISSRALGLKASRPNPGLSGVSVPSDLALIGGVPNVDFSSPVASPTSIFVRVTGNDANDGLSEGNAVRTVDKAMEIAAISGVSGSAFRIDIGSGTWYATEVYPSSPTPGSAPDKRLLEFIGTGKDNSILTNAADPSGVVWADNADGTYTATVTNASHAVDLASDDLYGNPTALSKVADLPALLAASEGFFVVGSDIRVKPIRAGLPDSNLLVFLSANPTITFFLNPEVYIKNLSWMGWGIIQQPIAGTPKDEQKWVVDQSLIGYTPINVDAIVCNAFDTNQSRYYFINTDAAYAGADCIDYSNSPSIESFGIEYNCKAYLAGWQDPTFGFNQSTTAHDGTQILRANCIYSPTLAATNSLIDVSINTRSWIYNCVVDRLSTIEAWVDTVDGAEFLDNSNIYEFYEVTNRVTSAPASATEYNPFVP